MASFTDHLQVPGHIWGSQRVEHRAARRPLRFAFCTADALYRVYYLCVCGGGALSPGVSRPAPSSVRCAPVSMCLWSYSVLCISLLCVFIIKFSFFSNSIPHPGPHRDARARRRERATRITCILCTFLAVCVGRGVSVSSVWAARAPARARRARPHIPTFFSMVYASRCPAHDVDVL